MATGTVTSDLLRGHADTMILRQLLDADRYGYEIVKMIAERSGGEYELKEATMYSSVRRLEHDGDITWYWGDESQGGRREDRDGRFVLAGQEWRPRCRRAEAQAALDRAGGASTPSLSRVTSPVCRS